MEIRLLDDLKQWQEIGCDIEEVATEIESNGHTVEWVRRQTRGAGHIVQGPFVSVKDRATADATFNAAVEACRGTRGKPEKFS